VLTLTDALGVPFGSVDVLVAGTVVTTNDEGRARVDDLPAVYDVAVVDGTTVYAFLGLTSRAPLIELFATRPEDHRTEEDVLFPADVTESQTLFVTAGVTSPAGLKQATYFRPMDAGTSAIVTWVGSAAATLSFEAFLAEVDDTTGAVTNYVGYATTERVFDGSAMETWTPDFQPLPFDTVSMPVEVEAPPGGSVGAIDPWIEEPNGRRGTFGSVRNGGTITLLLPQEPGADFGFLALGSDDTGSSESEVRGAPGSGVVSGTLGSSPVPLAPDDQAAGPLDTDFTWTASDGNVYELTAYATDGSSLDYYVVSAVPSIRLPDVSALGFSPGARALSWSAEWLEGPSSVDDFAAGASVTRWGMSTNRHFTLEP
jgi:hypothetical protein